jgi:hypothetical protein
VAGLVDELDAVLLVATDLVAFDEVVASGLGHAYAGFNVVVGAVAADDIVGGLVDVDSGGGVGEGRVALDEISVGAQVEHNCVVPVPIDDVVANDAVGAVFSQNDAVTLPWNSLSCTTRPLIAKV